MDTKKLAHEHVLKDLIFLSRYTQSFVVLNLSTCPLENEESSVIF